MVYEALKFMIIGMGIVYLFLLLLIFAINLQAKIIAKYFPQNSEDLDSSISSNKLSSKKVAAISAAVKMHIESK